MIRGIGTDIVLISKVEKAMGGAFFERVYTQYERAYIESRGVNRANCAAGIFAAKEAVFKALGTGIVMSRLLDVEITHGEKGAPIASVRGEEGVFHISISHDGEYAMAFCVWEQG